MVHIHVMYVLQVVYLAKAIINVISAKLDTRRRMVYVLMDQIVPISVIIVQIVVIALFAKITTTK
jgi:hypothetical protein